MPRQRKGAFGPWQTFGEEKAWQMLVTFADRRLQQTSGDEEGALDELLGDGSGEMNTIKRDLWRATIRRAIAEAQEREADQGGG